MRVHRKHNVSLSNNPIERKSRIKEILIELSFLLIASVLFALAFPNFLFKWGFFPLAYIAILPVFYVINRTSWVKVFFYGMFFGLMSYSIFNYWLIAWHPLAIFTIPPIYAFYFILLFPVLKLINTLFPKYGFIIQAVAWVGYEYLRTLGFLGYAYGVIGYTQYLFQPLIFISSITGIWGVVLIVIFPSAFLGTALKDGLKEIRKNLLKYKITIIAFSAVFILIIIAGLVLAVDTEKYDKWRVALIQQNSDPWEGGITAYRNSLNVNMRLSNQALEENPDIIVWSETSFVPSIDWYTRYKPNVNNLFIIENYSDKWQLVKELREYLDNQTVSFLFGNNDAEKRRDSSGKEIRVDFNATLLYRDGEIVDIYRKLHLVPFSEHFPFRGILNWLYEYLQTVDIHYYTKGDEYVVFEDKGIKFSTPICFEDTFGYLNRNFVNYGADVLVNMTNDSWSNSVVCQMQHMSMAVFRAVENRRALVRSSNGGITCSIDQNGRIIDILDPFTEGYLITDVPIYNEEVTIYTKYGDWLAVVSLIAVLCCLIIGIVKHLFFKKAIDKEP